VSIAFAFVYCRMPPNQKCWRDNNKRRRKKSEHREGANHTDWRTWTMGNLHRTSLLNIFISPAFTFVQLLARLQNERRKRKQKRKAWEKSEERRGKRQTNLTESRIGECSWKGPFFI
jgi:hypothetical protein